MERERDTISCVQIRAVALYIKSLLSEQAKRVSLVLSMFNQDFRYLCIYIL